MTINFDNQSGPPDLSPTSPPGADISVSTGGVTYTESTKCKIETHGICTVNLVFAWLIDVGPPPVDVPCPFISATHTFVSGGSVSPLLSTAIKTKAENGLVMRKGDTGNCVGGWLDPSSNPVACACNIEITDAGQTSVKAQ
jgi:hypothetical protein